MRKKGRRFSWLLCLLSWLLVVTPVGWADIQPDRLVIAQKLEKVAIEKGIPSEILKALAYVESRWRQWDAEGNPIINTAGPRPSIGIMQVTSYDPDDQARVDRLKNDIDYNIEVGADILNQKWKMTPRIGDGDRNILENWYFALWAYNSWTEVNNPLDCAMRDTTAFQDRVFKAMATEYYKGMVTPVSVTPIPQELLTLGTVPTTAQTWETPTPFHFGNLTGVTLPGNSVRINGFSQADTIIQIVQRGWPQGADTIILARNDAFPDALAGISLAKKLRAPILLSSPRELSPEVRDLLQDWKPQRLVLLGGEGALSAEVEEEAVRAATTDVRPGVTRLAGSNRYATAVLIAQEVEDGSASIAIATGLDFPDALSLSVACAASGTPILLTEPERLPKETANYIQEIMPTKVFLGGGEAVITPQVCDKVMDLAGLAQEQIVRFAGDDRYHTSIQVVESFFPEVANLYMASGLNYAEPLAVGALAVQNDGALLLVSPKGLKPNSYTETYLRRLPVSTNLTVIGDREAITEATFERVRLLLGHD